MSITPVSGLNMMVLSMREGHSRRSCTVCCQGLRRIVGIEVGESQKGVLAQGVNRIQAEGIRLASGRLQELARRPARMRCRRGFNIPAQVRSNTNGQFERRLSNYFAKLVPTFRVPTGQIGLAIIIREKDILAAIATLCNMMGYVRKDRSGEARHGGSVP